MNIMNKEQRQDQIIRLVSQTNGEHMLATRELAHRFGVSEMTVRRDLQELSDNGLLLRQHGGATRLRRAALSREIGIILVSETGKYRDPFFNAILEGVDRKLNELGYRIAYINTRAEINTVDQARELLESYPIEGLILVGFVGAASIEYLKANVRAVVQTINSISAEIDAISFDGYRGIRQVVSHLFKRGYRRLGYIAGDSDSRQKGFLDGVRAHDLPTAKELCLTIPYGLDGWTPELGHIGTSQLMQLSDPPDAIVCASDRIAIGAIQWLHRHHYQVPNDVAVTGFDDIVESAFTVPPLTTVHVYKELIGELAAERAVKRIENDQEIPLHIQTPTHLVIRESCGGAAE